jgi:diguanylate cyclase
VPVLAKGVETEGRLAFLTQESCDEVQGYLLGRPGPLEDHADLIARVPNARLATVAKRTTGKRKQKHKGK